MTSERWERIKALFEAALEQAGGQRTAFLAEACAGDSALRAEVEALIAAHEQAGDFMAAPAFEPSKASLSNDSVASMVGRRIGPYQVLREIANGGMGTVYLALRADEAYRKQVAIKRIKPAVSTSSITRRFHNERQILARLDHPNIAKLLDGGTTDDGIPYLIMDYIEGLPIDIYCDQHRLPTVERLKLFHTVCAAVAYAHQNQVVHRDLKPSNILVTATGEVKLLDFGIAKLLSPEVSSEFTKTTDIGRPMTLMYASPEQVRGEAVTAASDIYSLGVLLYELLTGHRPYCLTGLAPSEVQGLICDTEPEKPSAVINRREEISSGDDKTNIILTPESVSGTRDGNPATLRRHLTGDLDNIVMTALRKEPKRRYASVGQFSEDLRRHRESRPVIARKDTLWYRGAKFIKRNKASVITAAVSVLLLLALLGIGFYLLLGRDRAPKTATESLAILPLENLSSAPEEEYFASGMTQALMAELSQIRALRVIPRTSVMAYQGTPKPLPQMAQELNVSALVDGSVQRVGDQVRITVRLIQPAGGPPWAKTYACAMREVPALQSEMARAIAGEIKVKLTSQEQARLSRTRPVHPEAYMAYLRGRYHWDKRTENDLKKAIEYFGQSIQIDSKYAPAYAGLADSYSLYSFAQYGAQPPHEVAPKAEAAAHKALELDDTLAEVHAALGSLRHRYTWNWPEAEKEFRRAIELNPNYATAYQSYALFLASMGRQEEAIKVVKRAQELEPVSLIINAAVGRQLYFARRYEEAIDPLRKTLELEPNFGVAHNYLGYVYLQKRMYAEAIAEFSAARALSGSSPLGVAGLALTYAAAGQREKAQGLLHELQMIHEQRYVPFYHMAVIYSGLDDRDQAFRWLQKAYEVREGSLVFLNVEPLFDPIRSDKRFRELLKHIGLPVP